MSRFVRRYVVVFRRTDVHPLDVDTIDSFSTTVEGDTPCSAQAAAFNALEAFKKEHGIPESQWQKHSQILS